MESLEIMHSQFINDEKRYNYPFRLVIRRHDLSGTDYETVCYLSVEHATGLVELSGGNIGWLYGEPNWDKFFKEREILKAKIDLEKAERKLKGLLK